MSSPRSAQAPCDVHPRPGWCRRTWWAEYDRMEMAVTPCCCTTWPPPWEASVLGAFPSPVSWTGLLCRQLPPASDYVAWRQCNRALSVFLLHRFTCSQKIQAMTQQRPACCRDSSQQKESKFNSAIPCKVLWTPPELEEINAGMTAADWGLQAAWLWACICPTSFCWELESKGECEHSQAIST